MEHIILDADLAMGAPGSDIDDGFALALALADPEITVDPVTTVNGNPDVATATCLDLGAAGSDPFAYRRIMRLRTQGHTSRIDQSF